MIKYIDLFCGIGGFRVGVENIHSKHNIDSECVFSSDIDPYCQKQYFENFGDLPFGDIQKIDAKNIPNHDVLFAGFPCQPFSIIGNGNGFNDARGTLFFDIARILKEKKPKALVLENVKRLVSHHGGYTIKRIMETLDSLGYYADFHVLNALDFGLPQKRERVFIVGFHKPHFFIWPESSKRKKELDDILESEVDKKHFASDRIVSKRKSMHKSDYYPSIWHENKSGNISSYPYSCALRAGASYNYLLVNGERRLTPREMLRLQGFPDSYKICVPDTQIRKQTGNAVPVNVVEAVWECFLPALIEDRKTAEHVAEETRNNYYVNTSDASFTYYRESQTSISS